MLFFLDNRSYEAFFFSSVYITLTGRNYGMVVTCKAQQNTVENFKNRVVSNIHLMAEEKV